MSKSRLGSALLPALLLNPFVLLGSTDPTAAPTATTVPTPCIGHVHFATGSYTVTEEQGTVNLVVTRDDCNDQAVSVYFSTSNGTAMAGSDYDPASGTLNFAPGQSSKNLPLTILNDTLAESPETFVVSLSASSGVTTVTPVSTTITISDGVPSASVSITTPYGSEGSQPTATFVVNLSSAATSTIMVPYNLVGSATRYGPNIISNSSLEGGSSTNWALNSAGGNGAFTVTSSDSFFGVNCARFNATTMGAWLIPTYFLGNDLTSSGLSTTNQYTLSFYARTTVPCSPWLYISNSNTSNFVHDFGNVSLTSKWKRYSYTFTPLITGRAGSDWACINFWIHPGDLPLDMYIDGVKLEMTPSINKFGDYTISPSSSVTFSSGQSSKNITASVMDDKIFEGSAETLSVELLPPTSGADLNVASSSATFFITEDAVDIPKISFPDLPLSLYEQNDFQQFSMVPDKEREVPIAIPLTLSGTATEGMDYVSFAHTVVINPNEDNHLISVETVSDEIDETDESLIVTVANGSGSAGPDSSSAPNRTITIVDDDVPEATLLTDVPTVYEESTEAVFTVILSSGYGDEVQLHYRTEPQSAASDIDYVSTQGTISFDPYQTSAQFTVPLLRDCEAEEDESFEVVISDPVNATISNSSVVVLIESALVSYEIGPRENGMTGVFFQLNNVDCNTLSLQLQLQMLGDVEWKDVLLEDSFNPWVENNGCAQRMKSFSLADKVDSAMIKFQLLVTDLVTDEFYTVAPCNADPSALFLVSQLRSRMGGIPGPPPTFCTPIPTPALAPLSIAEPTPPSPPQTGDYMRAKYLSVGSGYQLSPAELPTTETNNNPPFRVENSVSTENRVDTAASVLVSQAVYGENSGLPSVLALAASSARLLGGYSSVVRAMAEFGAGKSHLSAGFPQEDKGRVQTKYMLTTQTLGSAIRGGTIYDSIRVASRHNIGATALQAEGPNVHTVQGLEAIVYATKWTESPDSRLFPLRPVEKPVDADSRAGGLTGYSADANLDNKRAHGVSAFGKDGGYIWHAVGFENIIKSNETAGSSFQVENAAGISIRSTFGESGPVVDNMKKYDVYQGVVLEIPSYATAQQKISRKITNGLLVSSQSRDILGTERPMRSAPLVYGNAVPVPESEATILTAEGSIFGDSKSSGPFNSDRVIVDGPVQFTSIAKPQVSLNLPPADRIGLIYLDADTPTGLRLSVAADQPGESAGKFMWVRLAIDESDSASLAPAARATMSFTGIDTADKTKVYLRFSSSPPSSVKWRLKNYGSSYIGESDWNESELTSVEDDIWTFSLSKVAYDGSDLIKGQIVEVIGMSGGIILSDSFRIE